MSGIEQSDCKKPAAEGSAAAHLVGIVMSAGGLTPLLDVLSQLPSDFPAAVVIVQHVAGVTELPRILRRAVPFPVKIAECDELLCGGTVYVAPSQHHIVVNPDGTIGLSQAPRVRFHRPSADWFFQSMAASFQERGIAVILSGRLDDGSRGIRFVRRTGGTVIVQAPASCRYPSMPLAAINSGCVSAVLMPDRIAPALLTAFCGPDQRSAAREWEEPFACV